uniref:Odorant Binding Protein 40 n=1 Tax=Dendrolimus punctatus TaxID=238572 RepID=A0A2K8GKP2_9NEOP|nr:Odorant Binding Protein 40 [Dendrolimus punctatus]
MTHTNSTEADLEYLRQDPPFPEKSACIVKCLLEKIGIIKNNRYSNTGFMTVVSPLVFTNKKKLEHMKTVAENCDKEVNHKEETPCQLGNEVTTCIFKYAPELHFKA